jgi:FMN phosphatase YigB (HAD superfamily)
MKKTTLLVDLDGTLLGSHSRLLEFGFLFLFCCFFLRRAKNPWPRLKALKAIRLSLEAGTIRDKEMVNREQAVAVFAQSVRLSLPQAAEELFAAVNWTFMSLLWLFFEMPEAQKFIQWAKDRYQLVLATNPFWPVDIVKARMARGKIDHALFTFITHNENMTYCKPNPAYYFELLKKINKSPEECLMIGNDERKDSPAAVAGIDVFILGSYSELYDKLA